ncbi:MAG: TetR/AcrR family transcriptional regulator [Kosmotoga sp.]|nr:MAG: TetR/AcrR family transcriptional regulator [Kosmotoga sp.]
MSLQYIMNMFISEHVQLKGCFMGLIKDKKEKTRQKIHKNALVLFEEKGFQKATMREIAKKSNIAVGTLYNYYNSKDSLIMNILEEKFEEIPINNFNVVDKFRDDNNFKPLDMLYYWLNQYLDMFFFLDKQNLREFLKIMFSNEEYMKRGVRMDEIALEDLTKILEFLDGRNKLKKNTDIKKASYSIYSLLLGQTLGYLFYFENMTEKQFEKDIKDMIKMFYNGIKKY